MFTRLRSVFLFGVASAVLADGITDGLLMQIQRIENTQPFLVFLQWTSSTGSQDFVRTSTDLENWRLVPMMVEGDGAPVSAEVESHLNLNFFQIVRQPKSDRPWVTPPATTSLAVFQLFHSEAIQAPVSYHIYLPPAYELQPLRRFPVIYWLHGSGPGVLGIPVLTQYFHNAIQSGKIPPLIVVFPNGLPDGMWCNSKDGTQAIESMVIDELIPYIDSQYRTIADRSGRIIEGFSMGGYGAARLGLTYPDRFGAFSMMGAGPLQLDFLEDHPRLVPLESRLAVFASVFGNDMEYFESQSPWRIAQSKAETLPGDLLIRQIVGTADSMVIDNRRLHQHFIELGVAHSYVELEGIGHNTMNVFNALGTSNFDFYNLVLSSDEDKFAVPAIRTPR
jgi:enterochelin esterase-like enzyme